MKKSNQEMSGKCLLFFLLCALGTMPAGIRATLLHAEAATSSEALVALRADQEAGGSSEEEKKAEAKPDEEAQQRQELEQERLQQAQEREREKAERERENIDRSYESGTRALDKRQWDQAADAFDAVIQKGGNRKEGAYYWRAYAEYKQGKADQALATVAELLKSYPNGRWSNDAKALEIEIRQAKGQPVDPNAQVDEDLKLIALNGLMEASPERALPALQKLIQSSQPRKIKERALFVLSQSNLPKAREILADFARGKANPDVQLKAIEYVSLYGGKGSGDILADAYAGSSDPAVKHAILRYFMIGGDRERLLKVAKDEKDPSLRREAIDQLRVLGAKDELGQLYDSETDPQVKTKILDALWMFGQDKLVEVAQKEADPGLRRKAVELLGHMDSKQLANNSDQLLAIYKGEKSKSVRKAILEAFSHQQNGKGLAEIARMETDPEMKKEAIERLSHFRSEEGTKFFEELLNK